MDQQTIRALCAADMTAVNKLILARLQSDVSLINQLGFTMSVQAENGCAPC